MEVKHSFVATTKQLYDSDNWIWPQINYKWRDL